MALIHRSSSHISAIVILFLLLTACSSEEKKEAAPAMNASVVAYLQDDKVFAGGQVSYNMTLTNLGEAKGYDIAVEHRIFSTPAARVIKTEGEIVKMDQSWFYKDKKMDIPSDAQAGDYQLIVAITYGDNKTAEAGAFFTVSKPVEEVNKSDNAAPDATATGNETPVASGSEAVSNVSSGAAAQVSAPNVSTSSSGKEVIIIHQDRKFTPDKITIEPGTTVVWIQKDKTSGEVAGAGFSSGPLGPGKEFRHTFKKVGIFDFYSQLTKAFGTIIVDNPDNPTVRKRDPMSFQGGLNS